MYIQVEKQYATLQRKDNNITIVFDIEKYIKDSEIKITDKFDLIEVIQQWIDWECEEQLYDQDDYDNGLISDTYEETNLVLNMDELIEEYSYLITPEKKFTCCDRAMNNRDNYCPDCGTKLIY